MVVDTSEAWLDYIVSKVMQKQVLGANASVCDSQQRWSRSRSHAMFPGSTRERDAGSIDLHKYRQT